jgi:hypothetical protein
MGDGQTYSNTGFIYWPPYPINKSTRYPASQNFQNAWRPIASGTTINQLADTVFDIRNNIFWINNGLFAKYSTSERSKIFYRNNIYHLVSGYKNPAEGPFTPTSLGSSSATTLATGERIINGKLIVDSSNVYPQYWDMRIASDTSYAVAGGTNVGLSRDFEGTIVSGTPSIGIYQYYRTVSIDTCKFTYGSWLTCNNGYQRRSYTSSPNNCIGVPPLDSIQRMCTINTIRKFYYDPVRIAIYIESSIPGQLLITNESGSVVRNVSYRANGQFIGVRNFERSICFASTQGQTITFIRQ